MDEPRPVYRRRHRLTHDREYGAVFNARLRKVRGPLIVFLLPNGLPEHRLGLSVGRRVGKAHDRVRIKRLLREAFRQERAALSTPASGEGFDLVVSVRAHDPLPLAAYRRLLVEAVAAGARELARRGGGDG